MNTELERSATCEPAELAERRPHRALFMPRADVYESENSIVLYADLPGADEKTLDITVEKNILTIKAEVDFDVPDGHSLTYSEYAVGNFERKFTLPNEIDRDGITASMKNGVLKLVLPKSANSRMKKITVTAE